MTHEIEIVNLDQAVEAEDGQSVLDALLDAGVEWMHACGGFCNCTTCRAEIVEGGENLSEMEEDEKNTLRRFQGDEVLEEPVRLTCQAKVHGDLRIRKPEENR